MLPCQSVSCSYKLTVTTELGRLFPEFQLNHFSGKTIYFSVLIEILPISSDTPLCAFPKDKLALPCWK